MNPTDEAQTYILDTNTLIGFSVWLPIDLSTSSLMPKRTNYQFFRENLLE
jgi:hypothetical protein